VLTSFSGSWSSGQ